ncbi:FKBP-type peptidyl-prolyl cis-trans isomerase [Mariprofundus sp. EBB-1]|uniref:FKBP-type peptidyl-prolyl cis-trans isomerase n=1 Tax=Mariprofundus sp. EBB-1 TaxID=2650971 RepID=UPI000EF1AAFB|nr:FKBP-type peptidyl-prolyl cis-trans isomerase [Mariprofundus sp. EBB-1]RLL55979.1 FKBP-type peptidyl-prolyl cis-trans isomerase [Mariprofundus sp. EBB-1]
MKKIMIVACMAMLAACSNKAEAPKAPVLSLDNDKSKLSYAIGMDIGQSLETLKADLDRALLVAAINDRLDGVESKLSKEDAGKVKQAFFKAQADKLAAEKKVAAEKNITAGKAFLLENGKKAGVTTTASGLQYEVLTQGSGDKPVATDKVTVNYKGTLIDGTEFDSSYKRGQPASFPLNRVIAGWTEGVQLMSVGSKFKFVLPANLAYGEAGAGKKIGPNSVLVFEVELLSIGDPKPVAPAAPAK